MARSFESIVDVEMADVDWAAEAEGMMVIGGMAVFEKRRREDGDE